MSITQTSGPQSKWKHSLVLVGTCLIAIGIFFAYVRRPGDFKGYVPAGNAVLTGADIYSDTPPGLNNWPPFFSLLCVPLALLDKVSPSLARGLWIILNYGVLAVILRWVTRLVYGRRLTLHEGNEGISLTAPGIFVPLLLTFPYLLHHFLYHQVNLVIFLIVLGGLILQENGKQPLGGIAIGLAAAMKVMPILFLPYLAYRRRWRAALYGVAATAFFSLSPILVLGWNRFLYDFKTWLAICRQNPWGTGSANQSIYALWDRFLGHGLVPFVSPGAFFLPMSGDPRVKLAWILSIVVAGLLILLAFRGQPRLGSIGSRVEWSVVFLVSALFGPVAWKHYLIVLLLPNTLLYAVWHSERFDARTRRVAGAVLLVCFLLSVSTSHDIVGRALAQRLDTAAVVTYGALVLLAGLLWFRRELSVEEMPPI